MIRLYSVAHNFSLLIPSSLEADLLSLTNSHMFRVQPGYPVQMASVAFKDTLDSMRRIVDVAIQKANVYTEMLEYHQIQIEILKLIVSLTQSSVGLYEIMTWERITE